jgi:hypothetical protein
MFTVTLADWPISVTLLQRTNLGSRRPVVHTLDDVRSSDNGRECGRCHVRRLDAEIYRDQFGLHVWHRDCFLAELQARRIAGDWRIITLQWSINA